MHILPVVNMPGVSYSVAYTSAPPPLTGKRRLYETDPEYVLSGFLFSDAKGTKQEFLVFLTVRAALRTARLYIEYKENNYTLV